MKTLSQVLRKTGHEIYENIITIVGLSFLWFSFLIPGIFFLKIPFAILYLVFFALPSLAAVLYAMKFKLDRKDFSYTLFFKGFVKFYKRSLLYSLLVSLFVLILISSWWYYFHNSNLFNFIIAVFQSYFFIFINLAFFYTLPILVKTDQKISKCLKESLALFLQKGKYTVGAFIQIFTVGVLLLVTVVSVPLLFAGMLSVFMLNTYDNLAIHSKNIQSSSYNHRILRNNVSE